MAIAGFFSPILRQQAQQIFRNLEFRREILEFRREILEFSKKSPFIVMGEIRISLEFRRKILILGKKP